MVKKAPPPNTIKEYFTPIYPNTIRVNTSHYIQGTRGIMAETGNMKILMSPVHKGSGETPLGDKDL